jgi:hypothetical protein
MIWSLPYRPHRFHCTQVSIGFKNFSLCRFVVFLLLLPGFNRERASLGMGLTGLAFRFYWPISVRDSQ